MARIEYYAHLFVWMCIFDILKTKNIKFNLTNNFRVHRKWCFMSNKKETVLICRGVNSPLLKCIGTKKDTDFYDNWNLWDGDKVCFCKECLNKIYDTYFKQSNSDKIALYYTCLQINMPFIQEIYDAVKMKTDKNGNPLTMTFYRYVSEFQKKSSKKMVWKDFSSTNVNLADKTNVEIFTSEENKNLEKKWGFQDSESDYQFLEETFDRYTEGIEFVNSQQEDLYRDLCRDRLLLRKINDCRYNGEETIDKVQNRISKTMSTLKVDQFESKKSRTLSEQSLFENIRLCDENNVSEVYNKPTVVNDLNKIKYYNEKFSLRPLANMLVGNRDFNVSMEDIEQYDLK